MANDVTLSLSRDEALVLFEWLYRFNAQDGVQLEHEAEQRVLWGLEAMLEAILVEPFQSDYQDLLARARERVRDKGMGE